MGNSVLLSDVHGNAHQIEVQPAGPSEERAMYRSDRSQYWLLLDNIDCGRPRLKIKIKALV